MRTATFAVSIALAMLVGFAMGAERHSSPASSSLESIVTAPVPGEVIYRYCDAINTTIATGTTFAIAGVLSDGFVDTTEPGSPRDRDAFATALLTLHDTVPGYRVRCLSVTPEQDHVLVHLVYTVGEPGKIPLHELTFFSGAEILEVRDGRIVARLWSEGAGNLYVDQL